MIQRPKYNEIGLTEADNKVLISELTKYAEEGASDEELKAFRDTFISEKKKSTPKSGTQPQSTYTTKAEKSVSAPTSGSSGLPKPKIKDEREEVVTQVDEVSIGKPRKITTDPTKLKREDEAYKQLVNKKVAEYRQSTKVPVEERQAIEEDLKAKKEKQGFLNGLQTGLKQGWNKFVDVIGAGGSEETKANWKAEIDPFADERKEAVEFFKEQKVKPTPAQIEQKTDEIYIKNKTLQAKQDRINDYLGSIDEQEKTYLEVDAQKRFPTISKKRQEILERISMNEKALAKSIADLKNPMTDEDRALVEDEITKITKYLDEDNALFSKATDELGTAQEEFDAFRRNYNWVENAKARITSSLVEGGLSFLEGLDYLGTLGGNLGDQKQSEQLFKDSEKARQGISEFREQFRPENKELTLDNFFQYSTDLLANQSGTLLTIAGAGQTGGASILGLGQAGQTYAEMRKANKNGANYAPWQMVLAPAVSGTSTGILSASPTFETLKNAKNVWKSALKDPLAKGAVENAIKNTSSSITKQVIGDTRKEVTTELLDNTIQNAVKRDILGDKSVGYFDNSWQVLKDTALMTGLLNAGALPQVTMEGVKMFSKPENNKVLDANGQKIAQLLPQLDNENISEVSRKAIESEIDKATAENTQIINSTLDKIAKFPDSDVKKVVENNKKQGELISEAEAIKEDNSIEIPSKKILLDAKKQEYQKVQESTNEIINAETKSPTPESEVKSEAEVQKPTENKKVEIPEAHREEYNARINQYESFIQELEDDLKKEESKGMLTSWLSDGAREKKWIKENITRYKNKINLLKENPVEFYKQELKDVKESHEERINEDSDYKQRAIDEYGTTDFDVVYSDAINNFNKKISDYEVLQKTANENVKQNETQAQGNTPTDGGVRPTTEQVGEMATEQSPKTEVAETKVVESAVEPKSSEGVAEVDKQGEKIDNISDIVGLTKIKQDSSPSKGDLVDFGDGLENIIDVVTIGGKEYIQSVMADGSSDRKNLYPLNEWDKTLSKQDEFYERRKEMKASEIERQNRADEKAKKEAEQLKEFNDIDGFAEDKTNIQKGKIIQHLNKKVYGTTIKTELRRISKLPYREIQKDGKTRIIYTEDNGTEFLLSDIYTTKTGLDYLEYLSDKKSKQPTRKETRKKAVEVKIDEIANSVKNLESVFGIKIKAQGDDINIQGTSREQLIDFVAKTAKEIAKTGIEIDEAIRTVIDEIKKSFDTDIEVEEVRGLVEEKPEPKKQVEFIQDAKDRNVTFSKMASTVPNTGEIAEYLSGETIEKYTSEKPENDQEYKKINLIDSLKHGVNTIQSAKEEFGDEYVSKVLEFADKEGLSIEAKALLYVSLENELNREKLAFPENKSRIQKQLNLVRTKSQAFARSNSLALNMRRLQAFAKVGFDVNEITDRLFSNQELKDRRFVEKAIQATPDEINKEYENQTLTQDEVNSLVEEGVEKKINEIYNSLSSKRRQRAEKTIIALENIQKRLRSKAYDASIGVPIAIIDAGITTIKNAIKLGVNIADAVELGINEIKSKYGKDWQKEEVFRKDMLSELKREGIDVSEKQTKAIQKEEKIKEIVKNALIEKGYFREVTYKTESGRETKKILDWKKLAGEEGSIENLREKVTQALKESGYINAKIQEMSSLLEQEYVDLRASIIEKAINELENKNRIKKPVNIKKFSKRLSELYNFGLFEEEMEKYNNALNSALGFDEFEQQEFEELSKYAKSLSVLFGYENPLNNSNKLSELAIKTQASIISHEIKTILSRSAFRKGSKFFKTAVVLRDYAGLSQRSRLLSLKQFFENPLSGFIERMYQKAGEFFDAKETGELKANRKRLARYIYNDIVTNGGLFYGEVSSTLVSQTKVEDWLNKQSDNKLYHVFLTSLTGRSFLEASDSLNKALITEKFFMQNLIKILTDKSNPNGQMTKDEAMSYVSEKLTGQNMENALKIAEKAIDKVNQNAGKEILPKTTQNIYRFATDIVKESLAQGNKLSLEEVEKSYNAAYKSAGSTIGHEANNAISRGIGIWNARNEAALEKSIKQKKWAEASILTLESILSKNILNPFVGGGTNWLFLTLQKSGMDPISLISDFSKYRSNRIDLTTEEGVKNLENALVRSTNFKNVATRNLIGAFVSVSMALAYVLAGDDDEERDLSKWLKENPWGKRYFTVVSPQMVNLLIANENEELGKEVQRLLNIKMDHFDNSVKLVKAIDKENASVLGELGRITGQPFDTPIPWRIVKDIYDLKRGLNGQEPLKSNYVVDGFFNGYFQGGLLDYLGLRPESVSGEPKSESGPPKLPSMPSLPKLPKMP